MKQVEAAVTALFKEIMQRCKAERRRKNDMTYKDLAKKLDKTVGYVSAFESGRAYPSIKTFLRYLIVNGFDPEPLKGLRIDGGDDDPETSVRNELLRKINLLDYNQMKFLLEQTRIAEFVAMRSSKGKLKDR